MKISYNELPCHNTTSTSTQCHFNLTYLYFITYIFQRYYGKSLPFGPTKSFQMPYAGYLTVEQTMADFAVLIDHLKTSLNASNCPVIAFGGR